MKQTNEQNVPAFLLPHLADIAKAEGLSDYTIEHEAGSKKGDGFLSDMLAITLVGKDNSAEPDKLLANKRVALICKMQQPAHDGQIGQSKMFEREVFVYNRLLPLLIRIQRHYGINEQMGFFAFPKCYAAVLDIFTDESFIIMEDLRAKGYALLDQKAKPIGLDEAKIFVEQLGRFHGLSFVVRETRPEVFQDFIGVEDHFCQLIEQPAVHTLFKSTYETAAQALDKPEDIAFINKLHDNWRTIMKAGIDKTKFGKFGVFGHGDCWNNNLMYLKDGETPTKVCLIDWQFSRPASPVDDLIMYLCSTTEKPLRDEYYEDLVGIYYDSLADIIRNCECDPEKLITYEELKAQMAPFGAYGVVEAPLTVSLMAADRPNEANDTTAIEKEKLGGYEAHMAKLNGHTHERYKKRLADVLADARKYGWCTEL